MCDFAFHDSLNWLERYSDLRGVMISVWRFSTILLLACLLGLLGLSVDSAEILVDANCSLADAIAAANNDRAVGGCTAGHAADVIQLSGNIALNQALPWISSEIDIEGSGFTISGQERFRHFNIDGGKLTVSNLVLIKGHDPVRGGSMLLRSGELSINDSKISDNSAGSSGVLSILSGTVTINRSSFSGNEGGTIYNNGSATIARSSFSRNVGSSGGAIANKGRLKLTGSVIRENHATVLAGAVFNSGSLAITHSRISDNGYSGVLSTGPIYQVKGELSISDSSIIDNEATDDSSAVFVVRGESSLNNNAIYGNSRDKGWEGPPRPPLEPFWLQDLGPGRRGSCGNVSGGGAYWIHPLPQGIISRGFKRGFHGGIDFAASMGTPIRAANGGPIAYAGWRGEYGIAVEIRHGFRRTLYAHLGALMVRCGDTVAPGQVIGFVGNTGNSTAPHLHFEIRTWGRKQDPMLIEYIDW